jgi:murein DD-endopeptidase MepM/ murein hydrolase activator NlpD
MIGLVLPTDNDALFTGHLSEFYQAVERNLHGVISHPWQGGQYGFVRDPVQAGGETIFTHFHEGMDIRPLRRDAEGEPLDEVHAIAAGKVVYTNTAAGASNYGRYVVIEHRWDECPYYSLYAHLNTIAVHAGEFVRQGQPLAIMGHTGAGIDRARAHVHVELNLLLSDHFAEWHDTFFKGETNHHGIYNGINLAGLDLPGFFLALRRDPALTIPAFLQREKVFYKVIVPDTPNFELPHRYPWMLEAAPNESPKSWEISFTRSGLPLQIAPATEQVREPQLSFLQPTPIDASEMTRGNISGHWPHAHLTESGKALMRLLNFPD